MNLLRQKLNSSNGRKHFIVAYNLSETLLDNKMELECNDYRKIKEIIDHISKQRFEARNNSIMRDGTKLATLEGQEGRLELQVQSCK